jgi:transcriptional regulator NrdR family protein
MKITRRQLREAVIELKMLQLNEQSRPWGSYSEKSDDSYSDTIVMSPNGDSVLVDGLETYIQDVPSQLEHASGFPVPDMIGDVITTELENQEQSGYIEMGVEYKNGEWTGSF